MTILSWCRARNSFFVLSGLIALATAITLLIDPSFQTAFARATCLPMQQPTIDWGAKDTSIKQLLAEKHSVLYPAHLPQGFQQTAVKKAWVVKDLRISPAPSRKVAFIAFCHPKETSVAIFLYLASSFNGVSAHDNLVPVQSQGYFNTSAKLGDAWRRDRVGNCDYLMVFRGFADEEIPEIVSSLKILKQSDIGK